MKTRTKIVFGLAAAAAAIGGFLWWRKRSAGGATGLLLQAEMFDFFSPSLYLGGGKYKKIVGTVKDKAGHPALGHVLVYYLTDYIGWTQVKENGYYQIWDLAWGGPYTIKYVSNGGDKHATKNATVPKGGYATIDLRAA